MNGKVGKGDFDDFGDLENFKKVDEIDNEGGIKNLDDFNNLDGKDYDKVALFVNIAAYRAIPGLFTSTLDKTSLLAKAGFDIVFMPEKPERGFIEKAIRDFLAVAPRFKKRFVWIAGKFGDQDGAYLLPSEVMDNGLNAAASAARIFQDGIDIYPLFSGLEPGGKTVEEQAKKETYYIIESGYRFGNHQFHSISDVVQDAYLSPAAKIDLDMLPANSICLHVDGVAMGRAVNLGTRSRSYVPLLHDAFGNGDKPMYDVFYQTAKIIDGAGLKDLKHKYQKFAVQHARTAGVTLYDKRVGQIPTKVFNADKVQEAIELFLAEDGKISEEAKRMLARKQ